MGLTEKFKENSCKLILYVINETFHSYVNIKCLGIFFPFFFSFPFTELPFPDLHYVFVCFIGWWVGWHGGIFSWEEELIAESCDSFTEQTAVVPLIRPSSDVHPAPGDELPEGSVCLSPRNFLSTALTKMHFPRPNHTMQSWRCRSERPCRPRCAEPSMRRRDTGHAQRHPHLQISERDFPGLLVSYRAAVLPPRGFNVG